MRSGVGCCRLSRNVAGKFGSSMRSGVGCVLGIPRTLLVIGTSMRSGVASTSDRIIRPRIRPELAQRIRFYLPYPLPTDTQLLPDGFVAHAILNI